MKLRPEEAAFQKHSKLKLEKRIYFGDGVIYTLADHPNKLVKIVHSYKSRTRKMLSIFKYLEKVKNPAIVRIYKTGSFRHQNNSYYYYVMDRLDRFNNNDVANRIREYIAYNKPVKNKESGSVKSFVKKARKLQYCHRDIHSGNIMKSKRGALKFVDLESFAFNY